MTLNQYKIHFLNTFIESTQYLKYMNSEGKVVIDFDDLEYVRNILNEMLSEEDRA